MVTALLPEFEIPGGVAARTETVERTLFNPTRRPAPQMAQEAAASRMKRGQFALTGTLLIEGKNTAFLREVAGNKPRRVHAGETINGMRVAEVKADRVVLALGDESEELTLKVATNPRPTPAPVVAAPQPAPAVAAAPAPAAPPPVNPNAAAAAAAGAAGTGQTAIERRRAARAAAAAAQAAGATPPAPAPGSNHLGPGQPAISATRWGSPGPEVTANDLGLLTLFAFASIASTAPGSRDIVRLHLEANMTRQRT